MWSDCETSARSYYTLGHQFRREHFLPVTTTAGKLHPLFRAINFVDLLHFPRPLAPLALLPVDAARPRQTTLATNKQTT